MNYQTIKKQLKGIIGECEKLPNKQELGEKAMGLIGDYPLYASGLSNISYGEAIAIAVLMFGDIDEAIAENENLDALMEQYYKTPRKERSVADYDAWLAERKGGKNE